MNMRINLRIFKQLWVIAAFSIIVVMGFSGSGFCRNWDWDQNHDCVKGEGGIKGWGKWGYDGKMHGEFTEKDCCELYCKACPVYANTGRYQKTITDLTVSGVGPTLSITRTYNSQEWSSSLLGYSWTFNFGRKLIITRNQDGEKIIGVLLTQGEKNYYREDLDGTLTRLTDYGATYDLIKKPNNTYAIYNKNGSRYELLEDGKIDKIIDRNQNELVFSYNSVGCLSRITNASGNYIDFQLGPNGKIASASDKFGRTITYEYDDNGNLITVTDPLGNTTQYTYNSNNYLIQIIDARGNVVEAASYDNNQPPRISSFTEKGETYTITYFDGRTEKTDSNGNKWTYYFNDVGVIKRVVDPLGNEKNQQLNKVTSISVDWEEDFNGNRTSYTYDSDGNIASKIDPLGNKWIYSYVPGTDRLETETDPMDVVTKYQYDGNGNQTTIISDYGGPSENTTTYTYDSRGHKTNVTDPIGNTTTYEYDVSGNMIRKTDPLKNVTTYTYDNRGNLIAESSPLGSSNYFEYDILDRIILATDNKGNISRYYYDANGNMTTIQYPDGNATQFEYDNYNRLTIITDPLGNIKKYTYDENDNILEIVDEKNNKTILVYDQLGRVIRTTNPQNEEISYCYDSNGNIISITDSNGNLTSFLYDQRNKVSKKTYPDGSNYLYYYDPVGNMVKTTDPNGIDITYEYDRLNRLTKEYFQNGTANNYTYNLGGYLLTEINPESNNSYSYDALGRVTEVSMNGKILKYEYDNDGNRSKLITPEGEIVNYKYNRVNQNSEILINDNKVITYSYNSLNRVNTEEFSNGSRRIYSYNNNGGLLRIQHLDSNGNEIYSQNNIFDGTGKLISKETIDGTISYSYDKIGQLISAISSNQEIFSYDSSGNRLLTLHTNNWAYNNRNQLTEVGNISLTYDANGNTIAKSDTSGDTTYSYDSKNKLVRVEFSDGNITSFKYDIKGRRIEKNHNGKITKYLYDGNLIIAEYDGTGNLVRNYFYSSTMNTPAFSLEKGNVYFFHGDHIGTPIYINDINEVKVWEAKYDSFGDATVSISTFENNFRFPGQYFDSSTGFSYNYYRYYNSQTGRYLTEDPLGFVDSLNVYSYVGNDPINFIDILGLFKDAAGKDCDIQAKRLGGSFEVGHDWIEWGSGSYGIGFYPRGGIFTKPGWVFFGNDPHTGETGSDVHPWNLSQNKKGNLFNRDGIECKCAKCDDMKGCIKKVGNQWHQKKKYIFPFQTCRSFVSDALSKCCINR